MADINSRPSFGELNQFKDFVKEEFNRREKDIGFDYKKGYDPEYKGPRAAWVRVCSNAEITTENENLEGFIMYGVNGFDDTYGFQKNTPGTVLGYDVNGKEHKIKESSFKHRPCPGVTNLDIELVGGNGGKYRKSTIKWTCWSEEQLEYLSIFFLTPGLSIIVEWGWNNYNTTSLFDLKDKDVLSSRWEKVKDDETQEYIEVKKNTIISSCNSRFADKLKSSKGSYDFSFGRISDYQYQLRDDGGYDVSTTISNPGLFLESLSIKDHRVEQNGILKSGILEYVKDTLPRIKEFSESGKKNFINTNFTKETRAFYADQRPPKATNNYELFKANENSCWITMGLLIDIINYYYSKKDTKSNIDHYKFIIADSVICAHTNLKSSDSSVLLIPNMYAPTGLSQSDIILGKTSAKDIGEIFTSIGRFKENINLLNANELLKKNYRDTKRIDLSRIICRNRKGNRQDNSFPNYTEFPDGNAGYLKNLYVNIEIVKTAISTSEEMVSALMQILKSMSKAAGDIWNFSIRSTTPSGNNLSEMTIVDSNYIGKKNVNDLLKESTLYKFDLVSSKGIVKNANFSVKPVSAITLQTMAEPSLQERISMNQKQYIKYIRKDRFLGDLNQTEKTMEPANKDRDTFKRSIVDPNFAIVKNAKGENIRLCEPSEILLKTTITDKNPHNNAIFNGIMPGTSLELTVQGISGIEFLDCFAVKNGLPFVFKDGALFQVMNVKHVLNNGNWDTIISAGVRAAADFST